MSRSPLPGPTTRKNILLLDSQWKRIAAFRHTQRIGTEMEALRRLLDAGLDAEADPELAGAFSAAVDRWRVVQPGSPSRAEAIRRLVAHGLEAGMERDFHRVEVAEGQAEIARLRALLAEAGVDPDAPEGDAA